MTDNSFIIRRATPEDLPALAEAHRASILEIGPDFYSPEVMAVWGRERNVDGYREAMNVHGETYFIAEPEDHTGYVLGFSSHRLKEDRHCLEAFYVRGTAARRGIGSQLLAVVEDFARASGAKTLHVEASLSGEAFYLAKGFTEQSRHARPMGDVTAEAIMMKKEF